MFAFDPGLFTTGLIFFTVGRTFSEGPPKVPDLSNVELGLFRKISLVDPSLLAYPVLLLMRVVEIPRNYLKSFETGLSPTFALWALSIS